MRARAEVRRAGRRAAAKQNVQPLDPAAPGYVVDVAPEVSRPQRIVRRAFAVLVMLSVVVVGGALILLTAITPGKGSQVGPILAAMVAVMFGFPGIAVLFRYVQNVWYETAPANER
jgi:hypothetical protein